MSFPLPQLLPGSEAWEKVLHRPQPYADNHVDESFLTSLATNANVEPYAYWDVVHAAAAIVQQLSIMLFFMLTLRIVTLGLVTVTFVALANIFVAALGVTALRKFGPQSLVVALLPDTPTLLGMVGIFAVVLFVIAPVLQTLASSWSDEAVFASTLGLALLHTLSHNYHSTPTFAAASEAPVALGEFNVLILASALLSSRLPSTTHVFIFVGLAIEYFVLYPIAREEVRLLSEAAFAGLTLFWCMLTLLLLASMHTWLSATYFCVCLFIIFGAPLLLVRSQTYKSELRGPWDIAELGQG